MHEPHCAKLTPSTASLCHEIWRGRWRGHQRRAGIFARHGICRWINASSLTALRCIAHYVTASGLRISTRLHAARYIRQHAAATRTHYGLPLPGEYYQRNMTRGYAYATAPSITRRNGGELSNAHARATYRAYARHVARHRHQRGSLQRSAPRLPQHAASSYLAAADRRVVIGRSAAMAHINRRQLASASTFGAAAKIVRRERCTRAAGLICNV